MTTCAIMQPTYLPWAGYFNLINSVDHFVFLDDVQFERRSWQSRNRIIINNKINYLTVPVTKSPRNTLIKDIEIINNSSWIRKHISHIENSYIDCNYFQDLSFIISHLESLEQTKSLSLLNISIINKVCEMLDIKTSKTCASKFSFSGKKSEYLYKICKKLSCENYLSPQGSKTYIEQEGVFYNDEDINVIYQDFIPRKYTQVNSDDFESHLSIIDVIANIGIENAKNYVK